MKHQGMIALLAISLIANGCAKKTAATAVETAAGNAAFNSAITDLNSALSELGNLLPAPTSKFAPDTAFGTKWGGDGWMAHPMCSGDQGDPLCSTPVNLKDWMGYQLEPDARRTNGSSINIFGRLNDSIQIGCAIMNLFPNIDSTTGYPANGENIEVEFTSAAASILVNNCGFAADGVPPAGSALTATVTTPADTALYDKKIVFALPAEMGGATQIFYLRMNNDVINIANAEYGQYLSRTLIAMTRAAGSKLVKVEYVSGAVDTTDSSGFELSRLFLDEANDEGAILSIQGDQQSPPNQIIYTMRGKPAAGGEVGYSARVTGYGSGNSDLNTNYSACVDVDTGAIVTDNDTDGCTGGSPVILANSSGVADLHTQALGINGDDNWANEAMSDTITVPFTGEADIFTDAAEDGAAK